MKVVSVSNQKGGVSKTTTTAHLGYLASELGLRVLMVDFDTQNHLRLMFPETADEGDYLTSSSLLDEEFINKPLEYLSENLAIIQADKDGLLAVTLLGSDVTSNPAKFLKHYENDFDVCFIDTPPAIGTILISALKASDMVLTPSQIDTLSLNGVSELIATVGVLKRSGENRRLRHIGILPTMTGRTKRKRADLEQLRADSKLVLPVEIRSRPGVEDATYERRPVWRKKDGKESKTDAAIEMRETCMHILKLVNIV
jgi:chromosome partitioning protein